MSIDEWLGFGVPEEILEQATEWLALLDSNQVTDKQRVAFFAWLAADPLHAIAFEELSELWARTSVIKNFQQLIVESKVLAFTRHGQSGSALPVIGLQQAGMLPAGFPSANIGMSPPSNVVQLNANPANSVNYTSAQTSTWLPWLSVAIIAIGLVLPFIN
jgi:hypothetical protein